MTEKINQNDRTCKLTLNHDKYIRFAQQSLLWHAIERKPHVARPLGLSENQQGTAHWYKSAKVFLLERAY